MINQLLAIGSLGTLLSVGAPVPSLAAPAPASTATTISVNVTDDTDGESVVSGDFGQLTIVTSKKAAGSAGTVSPMSQEMGCTLAVHWPHGSHHVQGNINVKAEIECNANSPHLRLATSLIRVSPNTKQWTQGTVNVYNKAYASNNAATSCAQGPGNFRGWAWGTLTVPAGYTLRGPADITKYGDTKPVACGLALAASTNSDTDDDIAESITVHFERVSP